MLYNPKWEKPSLDGFISFLESKPYDEEYYWSDCDACAIGQYFETIGKKYRLDVSDLSAMLAFNSWEAKIAAPLPHNFGAALDRARVYQKEKERMPLINNPGPKIIGAKPRLNEDQIAVCGLLKEALAQALQGDITSIGIVACMTHGYAHVMAGRQAADLNLGCDSLKLAILDRVERAGSEMTSRTKQ